MKNFLKFIRIELSFFAVFLALAGFFVFSYPTLTIFLVFLASFFTAAGSYGYNNLMDVREDIINRKNYNASMTRQHGISVVLVSFMLGALFSFLLGTFAMLVYFLIIVTGTTYSGFRLKSRTLVKNVYSGLGSALFFLFGVPEFSTTVFLYYFLLFLFLFIGSIISDMRDQIGDMKTNVKTFPVIIGIRKTKIITFFLLSTFLILVLYFNLPYTRIFVPFALAIAFALHKNNFSLAHKCGGISFVFLLLSLVVF